MTPFDKFAVLVFLVGLAVILGPSIGRAWVRLTKILLRMNYEADMRGRK